MRLGSLFTGIGAFDRGCEAALGATTAWQVEIEPFPAGILRQRFPDAELFGDVREATGLPDVEVLAGGFPCQDLSAAGKGAGIAGARSGLWSQFARLIGELEPAVVLIENVPLLLRRGFDVVVSDLIRMGYSVEWDCLPAAAVGALHLRDRVWIVAHRQAAPTVFGEPLSLFPQLLHTDEATGWSRWPRAGFVSTDPAQGVLELEPLARVADVKRGRVLWATPRHTDGDRGGRGDLLQQVRGNDSPSGHFATPTWPTPAARDWKDTGTGRYGRGQLPEAVRARELLPTPKASPSGPDFARMKREKSGGDDLATHVARKASGPLNPDWVEWLMGLPVGWTNPDCAEPVQHDWSAEPVPRTATDVPLRKERLSACGNALVPQVAAFVAERVQRAGLLETTGRNA